MAIFKSKKTYIKRYASKNADKKVTFSPGVKSTFNYAATKAGTEKAKPAISPRAAQPDTLTKRGSTTGAIRYGQPDEKYLKLFTDKKPEDVKSEAVSAPDLTDVKADKNVRPIPNTKTSLTRSSDTAHASKKASETPVSKSAPAKTVKEKAPKKERKKADIGKMVSIMGRVALLAVIVCAIGVVGYRYACEYKERIATLNLALNTQYPPEDYIYPEPSESVKLVNDAAREAAYNEAMANAYMPSRSEVPGLYKYDYVKTCYLTFDDGPSGPVTESILNTLKEYNVPATFFVVGKNAEAYPDLLRRIEAEGHSIGNHSYSHNYEYMYSGDPAFDSELYRCHNAINSILGKPYNNMLYRFPGGSFEVYKQFYIYNIESLGYQHVDWNALTGDSEVENPDEEYIMNALKESTNNGTKEDIVLLMHDAGAKQITADTLPKVIEYLKSKNYVFEAVKNSNFAQ